jgi:hypothetical protein
MSVWRKRCLLFGVFLALDNACAGEHDVKVTVAYAAISHAPKLELVTVVAGGDKSSWPQLQPGDKVSVVLKPQGAPPQLTLLSSSAGIKHAWDGQAFGVGVGYEIQLRVDATGRVLEHHCLGSCR